MPECGLQPRTPPHGSECPNRRGRARRRGPATDRRTLPIWPCPAPPCARAVPGPSRVDVVGLGLPFAEGHRDRCCSTPAGGLRFGGEPVWVSDLDEKIIAVTTPTPCRSVSVDPSSASIAGIRWSSSLIRWVSVVIVEQAGGEPLELEPVGRAEPAGRDAILGKRDELREHAAGHGQRVADRNGQVDEHGFGLGEQPDALQDQGGAPVAEHGERLPGRARRGVLSSDAWRLGRPS